MSKNQDYIVALLVVQFNGQRSVNVSWIDECFITAVDVQSSAEVVRFTHNPNVSLVYRKKQTNKTFISNLQF